MWSRRLTQSTGHALGAIRRQRAATAGPCASLSSSLTARLKLRAAGRLYSHPDKFEKGSMGEDAFFVLDGSRPAGASASSGFVVSKVSGDAVALGVADGVADWVFLRGVDSAQYSRQLMQQSESVLQAQPGATPLDVLKESYARVTAANVEGSSTICIATFAPTTGMLSVANLVRALRDASACR
jgi:hypothetical protein